jgi:hypothetical protein
MVLYKRKLLVWGLLFNWSRNTQLNPAVDLLPVYISATYFYNLTLWSRVLLEKLIVAHLAKKFLIFMEPEDSLPCSQEPKI